MQTREGMNPPTWVDERGRPLYSMRRRPRQVAYLVVIYACSSRFGPRPGGKASMAISRRMLALIQKIEAADAEHFARLRKSAKQDKEAKALAKTRAVVRSAEARMVAKKRKAS